MQRHSAYLVHGTIDNRAGNTPALLYLVCGTMHGWTDATASRQLATTLTNADDNFRLARWLIQGQRLGPVCIRQGIAATASGTGRLGILLPA